MLRIKDLLNICNKDKLIKALDEEFSNESNPSLFTRQAIGFISNYNNIIIKDNNSVLIGYEYSYYYDGILCTRLETYVCNLKTIQMSEKANLNDFSIEEILETRDPSKLKSEPIKNNYIVYESFDYYHLNEILGIYIPNCMIERFGLERLIANVLYPKVSFVLDNCNQCEYNDIDTYNQTNKCDLVTIYKTGKLEDVIDDEIVKGVVNLKNLTMQIIMSDDVIDEVKNESIANNLVI